jgi:alanyl-tRNA synthetase
MTSSEIRQQFLDFFKSKGHTIVPSAPIVVKNDPTLMFTNAGMNQFKDMFLGNKKPIDKRVADTQKCLRVSGKHNDLEEVGVDTYHHTMFEMLGNWSFGDYFKKEAIEWSWELLTKVYNIPKDRLYASVFEGDEKEGLPPAKIALDTWAELIPDHTHIVFGNKKDNFWEMGDTGPCGPCSEIHVDLRPDDERAITPGHLLVNKDHPQVIEIWNNVFMQYNRKVDGSLEPLPATHVDTGMGFERLVRAIQGKTSNYDTDLFSGTIQSTEKIVGLKYSGDDSKTSVAFRVLADHIRAISFTIADGQLPSSNGAGYVIRRILRRAVRYYHTFLNYKQPLLHQLVPLLAGQFKNVFPELNQQLDFVTNVVLEEEKAFLRTLDSGLKRLEILMKEKDSFISGSDAFELYDTFGFPLDLTRLIASENNYKVDEKGFNTEMAQQKARSRKAAATETGDWNILKNSNTVKFVGYETTSTESSVLKYRKIKQKDKELYQIVLDATPFYAESGGQVGDTGILNFDGELFKVIDTKKENDLIIHFTEEIPQDLSGKVLAKIDESRRRKITRHHSVTHLMQAALREVLGTHVAQKGSLNNEDYLRFDFSHFAKATDEEIAQIEKIVNRKIRQNIPVVIKELPKEEAMKLGAMALFGEKYGDVVRVVVMDENFSIELCGGTHVMRTGELSIFKIISESAVAAGVRRVEALAGCRAEAYLMNQVKQLNDIKTEFKNPKDIFSAIKNVQDENAALKKEVEKGMLEKANAIKDNLKTKIVNANGVNVIIEKIELNSADAIKKIAYDLKNEVPNLFFACGAEAGGKAHITVMISENIAKEKNWNAKEYIKQISAEIKGGGGGQDFYATAGGTNLDGIDMALDKIKGLLK